MIMQVIKESGFLFLNDLLLFIFSMIVSFGSGVSSQTPDVMLNALHVVDNKERNILFLFVFLDQCDTK